MSFANDNKIAAESRTLIDDLLAEQQELTAVEKFSRAHDENSLRSSLYRDLIPLTKPQPGQQYAFEVDLDRCTGCKACVSACHSLNGLDDEEVWRGVGMLISGSSSLSPSDGERAGVRGLRGREVPNPDAENPVNTAMKMSSAAACHFSPSPSFPLPFRRGEGGQTRNPKPSFQQHITTACHHCVDPGCLNGCPVLAYDKDPVSGIVRHLDDQCIGCQYCVMMCPYEVPQYSKARGIVRKCDMCHSRLAVGEAPACVQACPTSAIKITVVEQAKVRGKYRLANSEFQMTNDERSPKPEARSSSFGFRHSSFVIKNSFLPSSPNPAITLPTTRYVTQRAIPANLFAGDHAAVRPADAHLPLVLLLVLSQLAIGASVAALFVKPALPLLLGAFAVGLVAMGAGSLHLGQPLKAWRSFLGWRKSWFSREVIAFGGFVGILSVAVALHMFDFTGHASDSLSPSDGERAGVRGSNVVSGSEHPFPSPLNLNLNLNPPSGPEEIKSKIKNPEATGSGFTHMARTMLIIFTALAGLSTVVCSAMIYVDTRREFWNATRSFTKFFGTTLLLGTAAAIVVMMMNAEVVGQASSLSTGASDIYPSQLIEGDAHWTGWKPVPLQMLLALLALVTIAKLAFEHRIFAQLVDLETPSQTPLNKTARLLAGELNGFVRVRIALALAGGVVLPLFALMQLAANAPFVPALAIVLLLLCVAGELIERHLFFTAVVTQKMPGGLAV